MDRGAWWATVCEVTKSQTQLTLSYLQSVPYNHSYHNWQSGDSVRIFNLSLDFHQRDVINSIQVKEEFPK